MSFDYDLFVIGAGSGGVRAARMSAGYGARVAVAEEFRGRHMRYSRLRAKNCLSMPAIMPNCSKKPPVLLACRRSRI